MEKLQIKTADIKVRNPMAFELASGKFGQRIVKNKKAYDRKRDRKVEN